ncbi:hypothetical protein SAMD00079811_30640 [Scytonema sp. HK-05]|nr:hypothetical protein SAMD00079811_30640 [Scytonema sp. HK-05]
MPEWCSVIEDAPTPDALGGLIPSFLRRVREAQALSPTVLGNKHSISQNVKSHKTQGFLNA